MARKKAIYDRENIFLRACLIIGITIFTYYIYRLFFLECSRLGHTLCADIAEDFYSLYQAGHNLYSGVYIYCKEAGASLVTPYFMLFRYFPITAFLWGSILFALPLNAMSAYYLFTVFVIITHLSGLLLIWMLWRRVSHDKFVLGLSFLFWLSFFSLNSEWRMGQFNDIAGVLFLGFVTAVSYNRKFLSPILWALSLSFKPLAIFNFPYFLKIKDKLGTLIFCFTIIFPTVIYVSLFRFYYSEAITEFLNKIVFFKDRMGFQVHYIDNFSMQSVLAEIFFDYSQELFFLLSFLYVVILFSVYIVVTIKNKIKSTEDKIYYLLFSASFLLMYHRELWESLFTFWAPIVIAAFILTKKKWERLLVGISGFLMATPTLFFFWYSNQNEFWRFVTILEKALPQLVLFIYLVYKAWPQRRNKEIILDTK